MLHELAANKDSLNYIRYAVVNQSALGFVIAQMMELLFQVLRYHHYFLYKQRWFIYCFFFFFSGSLSNGNVARIFLRKSF